MHSTRRNRRCQNTHVEKVEVTPPWRNIRSQNRPYGDMFEVENLPRGGVFEVSVWRHIRSQDPSHGELVEVEISIWRNFRCRNSALGDMFEVKTSHVKIFEASPPFGEMFKVKTPEQFEVKHPHVEKGSKLTPHVERCSKSNAPTKIIFRRQTHPRGSMFEVNPPWRNRRSQNPPCGEQLEIKTFHAENCWNSNTSHVDKCSMSKAFRVEKCSKLEPSI